MSGLIPSDALFVRTHFEKAAELSQDSGCFLNNHIQPIFHGIAATFASAADVILYPVTALPRAFCEFVTEGMPEAIGSLYHDLIATCQTFMLAVIGVITVAISIFFPGIYNILFAPETVPSSVSTESVARSSTAASGVEGNTVRGVLDSTMLKERVRPSGRKPPSREMLKRQREAVVGETG